MRLLVSVRNPDECMAALTGGADIIDIKEPDHGTLGRADDDVIRTIIAVVKQQQKNRPPHTTHHHTHTTPPHTHTSHTHTPVSAALGELIDQTDRLPDDISDAVDFVKIGLAGAASDWRAQLIGHPRLIPVAYADHALVDGPTVDEIFDYAITHRVSGILIDTAVKNGQTLLDYATPAQLNVWINRAHADGLFMALAGSLRGDVLDQVIALHPDIIAVRGAACAGYDRQSHVDAQRVAHLKKIIANAMSVAHHHAD